jgi:non-heme chloroperoxidase
MMNKARLFYEDRSMSQGRTILFLHDWGLNRQEWAYPVALFSRGYRTITLDLPGFGRSDQPGGLITYDLLARDVGALAKVLDLNNVILVGAGMGAAVAIAYATRFARTLAGLVLVGPISPRWTSAPDFSAGIPRQRVENLLEQSETNWPQLLIDYSLALFQTAVGDPTRQWYVQMGLEASLYAVQQCLICMRDSDLRDELGKIAVPTAVFHGVHDAVAPLSLGEYCAQNIPNATLIRFERAGHAVWIDEAYRFSTALTGFIEERVFRNTVPPPGTERLPGGGERLPFEAIAKEEAAPLPPKLEGPAGQIRGE